MLKLKNYSLIFILIILATTFLSSYGTWEVFREAIYGSAFDSLAEHLAKLNAELELETIKREAMVINGKYYMYFGPFPAFLRMLLNFIKPDYYGNWTSFSKLLAHLINTIFFAKILLLALNNNQQLEKSTKSKLLVISTIAFAFASPAFYLTIHNTIYSESISWAFCFSTMAIYFYLKDLYEKNSNSLGFIALFTGLAMLSKLTFAFPLCLLIGYKLLKSIRLIKISKTILLLSPLILITCFQLWYNYQRFGNIFQVYSTNARSIKANTPAKIRALKLDFYDLKRVPKTFAMYFGIDIKLISYKRFPFIKAYKSKLRDINQYSINAPVFSFTLANLFFLITGLIGLIFAFKNKRNDLIPLIAFSIQMLLMLSFRVVSYRHVNEFMPLFIYLHFFYLMELPQLKPAQLKATYVGKILILCFCIYCTVFSSISRTANFDRNWDEKLKARLFLLDPGAQIIQRDQLKRLNGGH